MNRPPSFHRGRWAVARERFRLADPAPPKVAPDAGQVGDTVMALMKKMGLAPATWLRALEEEWPLLVGEAVARHTRPGRVHQNRLVVFVDSSVWLNELSRYGRREMLAALHKRFGQEKVKDLSLQLDPGGPAK